MMQEKKEMLQKMQMIHELNKWQPDALLLDKEADKGLVNLMMKQLEWTILEDERDLIIFARRAE